VCAFLTGYASKIELNALGAMMCPKSMQFIEALTANGVIKSSEVKSLVILYHFSLKILPVYLSGIMTKTTCWPHNVVP